MYRMFLALLALMFLWASSPASQAQGDPNIVWSKGVGMPMNAAYSADGSIHAVFSRQGNTAYTYVRIVRTSDSKLLHTYSVVSSDWRLFALSPDGQYFALGSFNVVYLYRVADGTEVWHVTDPGNIGDANLTGGSMKMAFSADGTKLIHASTFKTNPLGGGSVVVRSVANGSELFRFDGVYGYVNPTANEVAVKRIQTNNQPNVWLDFYDLGSGTLNNEWLIGNEPVGFTGDGQAVIFTTGHEVWANRRSDHTQVGYLVTPDFHTPYWFVFSGSVVYIYDVGTGQYNGQDLIYAWDVNTGTASTLVHLSSSHIGLSGFAVSPDGQQVAIPGITSNFSGRMYYSDGDGSNLRRDDGLGGAAEFLAMAPDGLHFATASSALPEVQIWETHTGTLTGRYTFAADGIIALAWSQETDTLAVTSGVGIQNGINNTVVKCQLISAADGHVKNQIPTPMYYSRTMTFTSNGTRLLTADIDGYARIWDVTQNPAVQVGSIRFGDFATSVAYSPTTDRLAVGFNSSINVWLASTGGFVGSSNVGAVDLAFTADGSRLAAGQTNGGTRIFNVASSSLTLTHTYTLMTQDQYYQPVAFDPLGTRYLFRSYRDPNTGAATLGMFDTDNADPLDDTPVIRYTGEVGTDNFHATKLAFTPDGQYFVYTVANGNVVVARNPNAVPPDTTPPLTTPASSPLPNTADWNHSDVSVTLQASDNDGGSGVKQILYSLDGGAIQTVSGDMTTVNVTGEGTHTLTFHAEDNAGNAEATQSLTIHIDQTAPTTTANTSPVGSDTQVTLSATDNLSGVAQTLYSLDGGAEQIYSGAFTVAGAGTHTVTYHSVDAADNTESTQTLTFTQGVATYLTAENATGAAGQRVTLKARLRKSVGNTSIAGVTVTFKVDGNVVGTDTTNTNGVASLAYLLSDEVGTHTLTAEFAGDTTYLPASASGTLTITQALTDITVIDKSVAYADTINLKARLQRTVNPKAIANKTLTFKLDGNIIGTATTNTDGMATLPYTSGDAPGTHTLTVEFLGDAAYASSTGTGMLTVTKANTRVTASGASAKAGKTVTLKGRLKRTSDGAFLSGRTLTFSINGAMVGTGVTDGDGYATLSYTIPAGTAVGTQTILVEYAGDENHEASSDTSTLTVK